LLSSDYARSKNRREAGFTSNETATYITNRMVTDNPDMGYTDFLLTSVSVSFDEKVQVVQTFGDSDVVYYFGKSPVIYSLSGMLIDDIDNGWFTKFIEAYSNIMRGTELARNYELLEITLPNMIIVGFGYGYIV
jgi:hypothetical protein